MPAASFMLLSCLGQSSTLMIEITYSSETSLDFCQITWFPIIEGENFVATAIENLKSFMINSMTICGYSRNYKVL
jgi:hypothetical protein